MKKFLDIFLRAVLAGFAVGIGCVANLSCDSKYAGALLSGTVFYIILFFGFDLFAYKAGTSMENKPSYLKELIVVWLGNLSGALIMGGMMLCTRMSTTLSGRAERICIPRLSDSVLSIFFLSFFCGMLMFAMADGFRKTSDSAGKVLTVILPAMVFIICGFDDSTANMFYFTISGAWTLQAIGYIVVMSLGNAAGGVFIPLVRMASVSDNTSAVPENAPAAPSADKPANKPAPKSGSGKNSKKRR